MPVRKLDRILRLYKSLIAGYQALKRDMRGIQKRVDNTEQRLTQIRAIADQINPLLRSEFDKEMLNRGIRYVGGFKQEFERLMGVQVIIKNIDETINDAKEEWERYESKRGLESFFPKDPIYEELEPTEEEKAEEEAADRKALEELLEKQKKESHLKKAIDLMEDL